MKNLKSFFILFFAFIAINYVQAQEVSTEADIFDYGKMWTFENAPKDYFKETYNANIDDAWLADARKSALRFASWCSASFVSPNGLIMTNHHCSNGEMPKIMNEGEDFNANGFYAKTQDQERKVEGLFVEQLLMVADITAEVKAKISAGSSRADALKAIEETYGAKSDWKDLRLQTVTFYSGGKYSLYGYKKYDDIRLVFIPELQLGFYGGDPDNFTYPRYNLDCTFWRAYENGKPANTADHYFKFNQDGAKEGDAVFVIGNPGRTERYRTVAQLEYDRDHRYNILLESMTLMHDDLKMEYDKNPSPELLDQIFGLSNGMKAYTGILKGLHDPVLFGRKKQMEEKVRAKYDGDDHWKELADAYEPLKSYGAEINLLSPSGLNGSAMALAHQVFAYDQMVSGGDASEEDLEKQQSVVVEALKAIQAPGEKAKMIHHFERLMKYANKDDKYLRKLLGGNASKFVNSIFEDSKLMDKEKKMMKSLSPKKFAKLKSPIKEMANALVPAYNEAAMAFRSTSPARTALEEKVANAVFQVNGDNLPPDATFTLRISDGVVQGYNYNGTKAPYKTTWFGFYDRHYSHAGDQNWAIPQRWMEPPLEFLKSPANFVSTNDIIGGNSGSPIINAKREVVGLIFDGNIESLPGNFIYEPTFNRAVSVHAGGMTSSLKYIYKANRLYNELTGK